MKKYQIQLLYNLNSLKIDDKGLIKKYIVRILENDFDNLVMGISKENVFYCLKLLDAENPTEQETKQLDRIYEYLKNI